MSKFKILKALGASICDLLSDGSLKSQLDAFRSDTAQHADIPVLESGLFVELLSRAAAAIDAVVGQASLGPK